MADAVRHCVSKKICRLFVYANEKRISENNNFCKRLHVIIMENSQKSEDFFQ